MRIAVVGGTGTLGRRVATVLERDGHEVRALSRSAAQFPVDLSTGVGLEAALQGCEVVIDASNGPPSGRARARSTRPQRRAAHVHNRGGGIILLLAYLTLGVWALLELGLRVTERVHGRGGSDRDRGTRMLIAVTLGGAIALALVSRSVGPTLRIPGPHRPAGLTVMWLGLAIRVWAIAALGGAFRTTVEVDAAQAIVSSGPYRRIRHPSYTGLLLILAGFGLAVGNWLAMAACLVLPLPALLRRIHVEETELTRVLGNPYRAYQAQTKRLVPGLW